MSKPCIQADRITKIEWLLDPDTWIVMKELKVLWEWQLRIESKIDWLDNKFVLRREFQVWLWVLWTISIILGIVATIISFTK